MAASGFEWEPDARDAIYTKSPHGLFSLVTPQATRAYRLKYGYGAAQEIYSLQESERQFREGSTNDRYLQRLALDRRNEFFRALNGANSTSTPGCLQAATRETGRVNLMEGDALGVAYGAALHRMKQSSDFARLEDSVLDCMRSAGYEYGSHAKISEHFRNRLIKLTAAEVSSDGSGRLQYRFGSLTEQSKPLRIPTAELDALRGDELEVARDEVRCRDLVADEQGRLLAKYSGHVIRNYRMEIRVLRQAIDRANKRKGSK